MGITGYMVTKCLQVCAELGIADALASGPLPIGELADAVEADTGALHRMLRALASRGIFTEVSPGRFGNTPLSEPMRTDVSNSVRDYLMTAPIDRNILAWTDLKTVVRTGAPARANGETMWDYFDANPKIAAQFHDAMASLTAELMARVIEVYDFSTHRTVVDVGGGHGMVLASILAANPDLRGVVFDQPSAVGGAAALLEQRGIGERCRVESGSFFDGVPAGYDAYLLKHILHDWSDDDCRKILGRLRAAIADDGTVLILDALISPGNDSNPAKWQDLHRLVALGGRERTRDEIDGLLDDTGFELERVVPVSVSLSIACARPR